MVLLRYDGSMSDFEKRWQRIQDALQCDYAGDVQPRVSSGRTLFGIKSEGEAKMEEFARQIDEENIKKTLQSSRLSTSEDTASSVLQKEELND